jgi:hypothetical protein
LWSWWRNQEDLKVIQEDQQVEVQVEELEEEEEVEQEIQEELVLIQYLIGESSGGAGTDFSPFFTSPIPNSGVYAGGGGGGSRDCQLYRGLGGPGGGGTR